MARSKPRRKTATVQRNVRKGGDLQKLHIKVISPRILMYQLLRGMDKGIKCGVVVILLVLITYGGYRGIQHLFLGNDKYRLQEIDLQTNGHLDHSRVVDLAGIDLKSTIFAVDTEKVRENLNGLPEVIDCVVERRLPGTLKIKIEERVPIVWINCESLGFSGRRDGGVLVDENGITFPCEGVLWGAARDLPVIVLQVAKSEDFRHGMKTKHQDLLRALHLVKTFYTADVREEWLPEQVVIINDYSLKVTANDGSHAVFGMYDHQRQLDDFITIREHSLKTRRKVKYVNLIPRKNIPVKFAGAPVMVKPKLAPNP